ncbi:MAG: tetratricopeptide repeat protein [Bacteroidota bacterium]
MKGSSTGSADLLRAAVILAAGIAAWSNSFDCSFHFDDFPNIVSNPAIADLFNWKAWMLFNPLRPVAFFTFALNYHFSRFDVFGYHLFNFGIHLANSFLVWLLIKLLFKTPRLTHHPLAASAGSIAFFSALLFMVHPLMTESVTYIVQRLVSLSFMFSLLSLTAFIKGLLVRPARSSCLYLLFSALAAVLGFFTKETTWILPVLMLMVYFFFFFRRTSSSLLPGVVIISLMFILLSVLVLVVLGSGKYFSPIPPREGHPYTITPGSYFMTQVNILPVYLRLMLLPVKQTLDYNYPMTLSLTGLQSLLSLALLLLILILALLVYKKDRLFTFGIFWFFITISPQVLVPRSNFIFEHRAYPSVFGFILVWVLLLFYCFGKVAVLRQAPEAGSETRKILLSLAGLLIIVQCAVFGVMTRERNKIWKDEYSLWSDCLLKAPGSARAMANLGAEQVNRQEYLAAITNLDRAIMIFPLYLQAWNSRAAARISINENETAVRELDFVIHQDPRFHDAYINRNIAFRNLKQYQASVQDLTFAISLRPGRSDSYFQRGLSLWMDGRNEAALKDMLQAAEMKNQDAVRFLQMYSQ